MKRHPGKKRKGSKGEQKGTFGAVCIAFDRITLRKYTQLSSGQTMGKPSIKREGSQGEG